MRPLTKQGRQHAGEDGGSSMPTRGPAQRCPQESSVVVLGVMYPSTVPQHCKGVPDDLPHLPPDVATGWQSTDVTFYDPISSIGSDELTRERLPRATRTVQEPKHRKAPKGRQVARTEAIDAIVRELARLSLKNHGHEQWTRTTEEPHGLD